MTPRETLNTQREASRTQKCQKSRRGVKAEKVHRVELLKDPLIVVRGGELVARELVAREHQPAARGRAASADRNRTAGAAAASSSSSASCSGWTRTIDVDCHPCASKQEQIVKFACGEQGLGRAGERSKRSSWCKGRSGVRGRFATERRTVKLRYLASSCEKVSTKNSISGSRLGTLSDFPDRPFPADQGWYRRAKLRLWFPHSGMYQ